MNLPLPIHLDIIDFIFKGLLIGIIASAPMGPVGILCIQRTLNKGRWYGFITGVGAAISDFIYALMVGLGMSFIMKPLEDPLAISLFYKYPVRSSCCSSVFIAFALTLRRRCTRAEKPRARCCTTG